MAMYFCRPRDWLFFSSRRRHTRSRCTAMWHLTGDDIQRAKEELKGRRAAIKAHYDNEMKQLETDIAAIETFERAAENFLSNFTGEHDPPATLPHPQPPAHPAATAP